MASEPKVAHFPISFESWYRIVSIAVGLPPSGAFVNVAPDEIEVRMGWAFRSRFPRSAVMSVSEFGRRPLSRGVHGFGGRWLVNGSGEGILSLELSPPQHAYVMGLRVSLKKLLVSVSDTAALTKALGHSLRSA